jgi:hypothetical protein
MKNNATIVEVIRRIALFGFSVFLGSFSLIMWKLPFQIIAPDFYENYLVPANGHLISYFLISWFLVGGYKTALLMAWDRNEAYFWSLSYQLRALLLAPLAPIVRFKSSWYKLPTLNHMRNK